MSTNELLDLLLADIPARPTEIIEPPLSKGDKSDPTNPYEGRWRWWYSAIADWMIRNPGGKLADCAKEIGRGLGTIQMIVTTDLFKSYLQKRKNEWTREHDHALRARLTTTAVRSLDLLNDVLEKKGDTLKVPQLVEIMESSLDRLGYAPASGPQTVVNVGDNRQQTLNVSTNVLQQAREDLRVVEAARAGKSLPELPKTPKDLTLEATEAGSEIVSDGTKE